MEQKLQTIIDDPALTDKLVDFFKLAALQNVPKDKNSELIEVFESEDLAGFYTLLAEHVPNLEQKTYQFIESISEGK